MEDWKAQEATGLDSRLVKRPMIVVHVRAGTQKWSRIGANGEGRRTAVGRLDGWNIKQPERRV